MRRRERGWRGMQPAPERRPQQDDKRRQTHKPHHDRASAHRDRPAQVPQGRDDHDRQLDPQLPVTRGQDRTPTLEMFEISHEQGRIDRHVKDRSREREPCLLETPKRTHRASHPGVEATFLRHGRGQFADHQRRRQTPEKREREEDEQRPAIAGVPDDLLQPIRPARDHKVSGRQQRQHPQLTPRTLAESLREPEHAPIST